MKWWKKGLSAGLMLICVSGILFPVVACVFRLQPKVVLSGSMEPEISTGSLTFIKKTVLPEQIKKHDIIAYQLGKNFPVLHRVMYIDKEQKLFYTKGDANETMDISPVKFSQYMGKEVFTIPYAGYVLSMLEKIPVVCFLLLAVGVGLIKKRFNQPIIIK